ncbi:MAG TPA: hypothetical protein VHC22_15215 [Pirellulales bacterium]|nr:hypothetical protein [Pirellulales bacterium]
MISRYAVVALLLVVGLATGCGKPPPTVLVQGHVTYNGKPLRGAMVTFLSGYLDAQPAFAVTDKDGYYFARTFVSANNILDGAFPGEYGVVVTKYTRPFPELVDRELWRRFGSFGPGEEAEYAAGLRVLEEQEAMDREEPETTGYPLSPSFRKPPDMDLKSIREMLALTSRQLRKLTDADLKSLRYPPNFIKLGLTEDVRQLAAERSGGKVLVPTRYLDTSTSGFTATIEHSDDEPLTFDFDLVD